MDRVNGDGPRGDGVSQNLAKFMDGLILFAAGLVYSLPVLVVVCLPLGVISISSLFSDNGNLQDVGQIIAGTGGVLFFCLLCVFLIYSIFLSIVYPAILVLYAREGTFASCFKFREVIDLISRNSGPFFTAWGIGLVAALGVGFVVGIVSAMVGWILCVGWIVGLVLSLGSTVYITSVYAHLFGQFGAITAEQVQPM